jgi:hypothetical protein
MRIIALCATAALLALTPACAYHDSAVMAAAQTRVDVQDIVDKTLPALSDERLGAVLKRAEELVKDVCSIDVRFDRAKSRDADEFLAEHSRRIAPFRIPTDWYVNPFADRQEFENRIMELVGDQWEQVRNVMPDGQATIHDRETAARALAQRYAAGLERLKGVKAIDGQPLIRAETWKRYSLTEWGVCLHSADWVDGGYKLYLSNTVLLDDALSGKVQELTLPPAMNGFVLPASRSAMVAYGTVLSEELIGNPRLASMSERDKDQAVSYVIAQMVGVFLLNGKGSSYAENGGLARPLALLRDKQDLSDNKRLALSPAEREDNRMGASYSFKVTLRMSIFAAQGQWADVIKEADRAADARFDRKQIECVERVKEQARQRLGAR